MLPMLGSIPAMIDCIKSTEERKTNKAIISEYYDKYIGEWKPAFNTVTANEIWVIVSDPEIVAPIRFSLMLYFLCRLETLIPFCFR